MAIADSNGLPVAIGIESANLHEVRLVEDTLKNRFTRETPTRAIGDKAYDSDPIDERMAKKFGTKLIAPHKSNRKSKPTQDGRELRRYGRRWRVEKFFAWLQNFQRIVTRWEYKQENFLGMLELACILVLMRRF